eukprot:UN01619
MDIDHSTKSRLGVFSIVFQDLAIEPDYPQRSIEYLPRILIFLLGFLSPLEQFWM